jgi:protein-L-isoaspartate(D-aspartate) O-methyltransferase
MTEADWAAQRQHMIRTQIRERGVTDPRVLAALASVPRERFVHPDARGRAYTDHALGIGHHQTISQPYMVAVMTEALSVGPHDRVLEIGTGSGYQCAVLSLLAREVWSVERIPELTDGAERLLRELGYANVHLRTGDGTLGWPECAPFDAIVVTAAAPRPPPSLLDQLTSDGGRLVVPVGGRELQYLVRVVRTGTEYASDRSFGCRFVPLLGEEGWAD